MPYHVFFGVLTFALSVVTSVLGFSEKIIFALYVMQLLSLKAYKRNINTIANSNNIVFPKRRNQQHEHIMSMEGLFLNFVSLMLMFYGVLVVHLLIKPEYKRLPKPAEDETTTTS